MGVEVVIEEFRKLLELIKLEYDNSEKKVVLLKDVQKLVLPGQIFENLRRGTTLIVSKWAAAKLYEAGIVEYGDKVVDLKNLIQLEWKEKNNPGELQELPRYFYLMIREDADKLDQNIKNIIVDVISLRLNKILGFASKRIDASLVENLTREETLLYEIIRGLIDEWLRFISPIGGAR
ncbi:MAG: DNA replication complex GINS family protein [Thaumarchaeota archaeon]|jgi:hypothetical protein|nr:DNA replication complex GINS family protein [Candidatus Geocrenenecus arthurdayi]MCL7390484.1 DNA replication complex GINS family protein [Candidatus Geocrenenecus arthurdayi]MCL7395933.1 DNA replication complex GINS family protein [Candidatus Geocrenenecus arthurdayi]MCL7402731.1 DNA replication complex GINS family protein [Candidatus Geocrenenecus arthurdayi]